MADRMIWCGMKHRNLEEYGKETFPLQIIKQMERMRFIFMRKTAVGKEFLWEIPHLMFLPSVSRKFRQKM